MVQLLFYYKRRPLLMSGYIYRQRTICLPKTFIGQFLGKSSSSQESKWMLHRSTLLIFYGFLWVGLNIFSTRFNFCIILSCYYSIFVLFYLAIILFLYYSIAGSPLWLCLSDVQASRTQAQCADNYWTLTKLNVWLMEVRICVDAQHNPWWS